MVFSIISRNYSYVCVFIEKKHLQIIVEGMHYKNYIKGNNQSARQVADQMLSQ